MDGEGGMGMGDRGLRERGMGAGEGKRGPFLFSVLGGFTYIF